MNRTEHNKKAMLKALEQSLGVVTTACKIAKISRGAYYLWMKEDEDFKKEVEELEEVVLDFAESQLHAQIKDGSTAATIFFLKTKGKKRGYVEQFNYSDVTPPELKNESNEEIRKRIAAIAQVALNAHGKN